MLRHVPQVPEQQAPPIRVALAVRVLAQPVQAEVGGLAAFACNDRLGCVADTTKVLTELLIRRFRLQQQVFLPVVRRRILWYQAVSLG